MEVKYSIEQFKKVLSEVYDESMYVGEGYHIPLVYKIEGNKLTLEKGNPKLNTKIEDNEIYCFHCPTHQEKAEHTKEDMINRAADNIVVALHKNFIDVIK